MLVGRGAEIIALASCMRKGNPIGFPCPHFQTIKEAVEKMFPGTKVAGVNTINMDGKNKRVRGTMTFGKTAKTKKAIVQLTEESAEIEIFQGL